MPARDSPAPGERRLREERGERAARERVLRKLVASYAERHRQEAGGWCDCELCGQVRLLERGG